MGWKRQGNNFWWGYDCSHPCHYNDETMKFTSSLRNIILLWAAWAVIILGFQTLLDERMQPARPDYAVQWSPDFTLEDSQDSIPYLSEPFMNRQVSMDSEYYLSIAVGGYDDPDGRTVSGRSGKAYKLNYAFFPLYPSLTGALAVPLAAAFDLTPIGAASLAGVIVSLLGTLGGMIALYDLTHRELAASGGIRTAFYLIAFPTGFFLAQVFTEGLFVGLAFGCLALARRKKLLLAGVLAALATFTRGTGLALLAPLALAWLDSYDWRSLLRRYYPPTASPLDREGEQEAAPLASSLVTRYASFLTGLLALALPIAAYLIWQRAFGRNFNFVEEMWFGRALFDFERVRDGWDFAFKAIANPENVQMRIYYLLELGGVVLALVASLFTIRRYPGVVLFGLGALAAVTLSGAPQSLIRYVVTVPAVFIFLSRLGQNVAFDKAWTLISILLMGMQTALFTWDMWVA